MIFVIGLALVLVSSMLVSIPLWRGALAETGPEEDDETVHWEIQKRQAYTAIREAELDREMGKLAQDDYQAIRSVEEARALEAMKALDPDDHRRRKPSSECPRCGARTNGETHCAACGAPSGA